MDPKKNSEIFHLEKIYWKIQNQELDKRETVPVLISYILNHKNEKLRLKSLSILNSLGEKSKQVFNLLENLIISEESKNIKILSLKVIRKNYLKNDLLIEKSLKILSWALKHENDFKCLIEIIINLSFIKKKASRDILISYLNEITNLKPYELLKNEKYTRVIKSLKRTSKISKFSLHEVKMLLLNYLTIESLLKKFYYVHFEIKEENGMVYELDLSDIEYEVRGWKSEFKNEIRSLNEINGLKYLQQLETLDLSNNLLKNIREISHLKNLKRLVLSKNRLKDFKNIDYLKKLPNLRFLSIEGNPLAGKLQQKDFDPNLTLKTRKVSYFQ